MTNTEDEVRGNDTGPSPTEDDHASRLERYAVLGHYATFLLHEQRSQLSHLSMCLSLLFREGRPEKAERARLIRDATAIVESMRDQQNDFLALFSMEDRRPRVVAQLGDAVSSAVEMATNWRGPGDARVSVDVPHHIREVEVPQPHLHLILEILLQNAIAALGVTRTGGGEVELSARLADGMIEISVSDNGPGIRPEFRDRIWEPGFTTRESRAGMGLTVVRHLVEQCGGRVWEAGEPGTGASFRISLPAEARRGSP